MSNTISPLQSASAAGPRPVAVDSRATSSNSADSFAIINTSLSPREALEEDLQFLRNALEIADVRYLLVRGADARSGATRPVLAVDERDRDRTLDALALACEHEPMRWCPAVDRGSNYSPITSVRRRGRVTRPHGLVSTGALGKRSEERAFVLYRPRVTPGDSLRYGHEYGVRLEFWLYDAVDIHSPSDTAMTRTTIPQSEAALTTINRNGVEWPTMEGMWDTLASDITFPIDIVFSWVDGTDVEWQRARAARMQSYVVGEGDDHEARFRQIDELKYAMRSVHLFAPWIRNIFVVTDSPRPEWLAEHPRVSVLSSAEFFQDPTVLPTYNSHSVESQLHRIQGLSEHFLYSNDDMFFGREVEPHAFFTAGGISRFVEANTRIGLGDPSPFRSGFENAARVNRALLVEKFGRTISRHLEHCPAPLRRSVLDDLESEFPDDFERTAASRFRSATDISVTNSLYHYFALATGRATVNESLRVSYVDTTVNAGIATLDSLLLRRDRDFFCLNDGSFPELSAEVRAAAVRGFLEAYFPIPAPWERESR